MSDVAAILLAAGRSTRYRQGGGAEETKLLARIDGRPMVRLVAEAALASRARPLIVVTGHARERVEAALAGLEVVFAHNPEFSGGLAGSLKAGVAATPSDCAGAIVLLADMPGVGAPTIDRLLDAFIEAPNSLAVIPVYDGARGNPVLIARALFTRVATLEADEGARRILRSVDPSALREVAFDDAGVALDIDTPEDLARRFRST